MGGEHANGAVSFTRPMTHESLPDGRPRSSGDVCRQASRVTPSSGEGSDIACASRWSRFHMPFSWR